MVRKYILPAFGHLTVDAIAVEHVRDWFASMANRPDSANRAKPVLSVMMSMAELWGYRPHNSNPCKNTRAYRTEPKERFLTPEELARLNAVLNRDAFWCPHIVAIVHLLMLTGCRLGEIVSLEWDWIRGKRIHLPDSKSGPRTVWLSSTAQVFPEDLTSARLYTFWVGIRGGGRAGGAGHPRRPPHPRLAAAHERRRARHRGEELPGHRRRATTAIYAHLDDAALRDAAAQAAAVIASAMGYRAGPPALPDEADGAGIGLGEPARHAPLAHWRGLAPRSGRQKDLGRGQILTRLGKRRGFGGTPFSTAPPSGTAGRRPSQLRGSGRAVRD